ncbi:MAG: glycosyltransferase family 39 protein [Xanthobacteraceae bacterium]
MSKRVAMRLNALFAFAAASHWRAVAALLLVCLCSFLPGFFTIPPIDRDEARFAQASKQMIETGDFVDIRFQDQARHKKPVGIYWLQAAVVKAAEGLGVPQARTRIWLYRMPSLLGAIGAVLLTYWAALAFVGRGAALLAGLMLATSFLLNMEARLATTDAMLLVAVIAAQGALGRAYPWGHGRYRDEAYPLRLPAIFWTALAVGILIKGPLILLFVALTALPLVILDRSARFLLRLRPVAGVAWMLLLVLPWFVAIIARSGTAFFSASVEGDFLSKLGKAQESHWGPPGYYFALFWLTFFPAAMLAPLAAGAAWRARYEPETRFLIAWLVPSWLVLELVMTKLPHYVLPLYPAIAILIAGVIERGELSDNAWLRRGPVWWFILTSLAGLGAIILHIVLGQQAGFAAWPFVIAAMIISLFAWWLFEVDGVVVSFLRAVLASILLYVALFGATFPAIRQLFPSRQIAEAIGRPSCGRADIVTAGFYEPSLVFLLGTDVRFGNGSSAADFLLSGRCRFAIIEKSQERAFINRADALGLRYAPGPRVEAYNLSSGRAVSLAIFRGVEP